MVHTVSSTVYNVQWSTLSLPHCTLVHALSDALSLGRYSLFYIVDWSSFSPCPFYSVHWSTLPLLQCTVYISPPCPFYIVLWHTLSPLPYSLVHPVSSTLYLGPTCLVFIVLWFILSLIHCTLVHTVCKYCNCL